MRSPSSKIYEIKISNLWKTELLWNFICKKFNREDNFYTKAFTIRIRLLKQLTEKFPFLYPKYRHIILQYRFIWVKWHFAASHFHEAIGRLTQDERLGVVQSVRDKLFLTAMQEYFANRVLNLRYEIPLKRLWRRFGSWKEWWIHVPFPPFWWRTAGCTSWFSGMFGRDWWIFPSK